MTKNTAVWKGYYGVPGNPRSILKGSRVRGALLHLKKIRFVEKWNVELRPHQTLRRAAQRYKIQ